METEANKMIKQPSYRFAGYTEPWEERKFSHYLTESRVKGNSGDIAKKLTVKLWSKGIVPKLEQYSGSSATQYYIRSKGQFMYGKLDFLNQAFGIIPEELDGYESTLDSPAFDISKSLNSSFLLEYVARKEFYEYQGIIANGSRKAKRIHVDTFLDMPINVPSLPEQTSIGSFFQDIDQLISIQQRKLGVLKEQKKTYLKLLFPAKGQTKPALRFAGFEDDWKEVKLGKFVDISKGTQRNKEFLSPIADDKNCYPVYNGGKQESGYTDEFNRDANIMISEGGASAGFVNYFDGKYWSGGHNFTIDELENDIFYVLALLESKQQELYLLQVGSGLPNIQLGSLKDIIITYPILSEQKAIGSFFQDLDKAIAKQEEKVNQLKESKQTLLRKMFI